jgi:hypothetical protein
MPVRIAIIKNNTNNKCGQGCGEKGILIHWWWECKVVQLLYQEYHTFTKNIIHLLNLIRVHKKFHNYFVHPSIKRKKKLKLLWLLFLLKM